MDLKEIENHWREWSKAGVDLRATTKTNTIKALEVDALARAIARHGTNNNAAARVLEAGCGNGQNCVALAKLFPNLEFDGFDYIEKMVSSARELANQAGVSERTKFSMGNLLEIFSSDIRGPYDVIFTDRAIINLNTEELQFKAIKSLCSLVRPGGVLLILENFVETYARQNDCREILGLDRRVPADFNTFLNGERMEAFIRNLGMELLAIEDFGSLHDLMLYVLLPSINQGKIEYDHPLVSAAAKLSVRLTEESANTFGSFGQNRLFIFRKLVR